MAISVTVGSAVTFSGSLSKNCSVAASAGDNIHVVYTHVDFGGTSPVMSANDGSAYTSRIIQDAGNYEVGILTLENVSAGTHTITCSLSSGSAINSFGYLIALSGAGLVTAGSFDKYSTGHAVSTAPATGSTATLSAANSLVVCGFVGSLALTGAANPINTGYTDLVRDLTTGELATVMGYKIVASNTAVSADLGTTASSPTWAAFVATFKGATSVVSRSRRNAYSLGTRVGSRQV